ncbi:DUF6792 domain-containing protein [Jeotgalibacillus campisalis]|uniref:DUF6792 domain-containing protein n=1 Tax=Jeotgalibacillus campisalis TaxID=220754 RepID=A0A0C2W2Z4_9BACL|nr:DUF6792 domain-containing protein [Jeotgalibacillus campisalis]KIL50981.1 hypothetical protein KR50_08620 [Jeotgalibacillus campisalis]
MNPELLSTDAIRLRVIEAEYDNLTKPLFIEKVQQIYFEETGNHLEGSIEVLWTTDVEALKGDTSGYNGTAIHFHSAPDTINQLYIISQGTIDSGDWYYNISSLLGGDQAYQATSAGIFKNYALRRFSKLDGDSPIVIGLAHSLAHNNNASSQLITNGFHKLYSVNGAQPSVYQLALTDRNLRSGLISAFPEILTDPSAIYTLPPASLTAFAEAYYNEKTEGIDQLISEDDPIYAISSIRGFFTAGRVRMIDTNPGTSGLRSMAEKVPDSFVARLQRLAQEYAAAFREGNYVKGIEALTGINVALFAGVSRLLGVLKIYFTQSAQIDEMIRRMNERIPPLFQLLKLVTQKRVPIWNAFFSNYFITEEQKKLLILETERIEENGQKAIELIEKVHARRDLGSYPVLPAQKGARWIPVTDLYYGIRLYFLVKRLRTNVKKMVETLKPVYCDILNSHSIVEMLQALKKEKHS